MKNATFIFTFIFLFSCTDKSIDPEDNSDNMQVSYPTSSTVWTHGQTGTYVRWSGFPGSTITLYIYRGNSYIDKWHNTTNNRGYAEKTSGEILSSWGAGSDYRIKVVDNLMNEAYSDYFTINAKDNSNNLQVSYPTSSTVWTHGQTGTYVRWSGFPGSTINLYIYKGASYLDIWHNTTTNGGYAEKTTGEILSSWGTGSDYRIKVVDNLMNEAYSEYFTINSNEQNYIFKKTTQTYSETANLAQIIINEFGSDYRLADWNDIVSYCNEHSAEDFINLLSWEKGEGYDFWVSSNGYRFWSNSNRHYLVTRFDHNKRSGYLAHANIDNDYICLGSWYNMNRRILAIKK